MIEFFSVIRKSLTPSKLNINFRRNAAVLLTFALLMPVAVPLPAWAYSLKIEQPIDDGLRLTASNETSTNFLGSFFGNPGAFILPNGKSEPNTETNFSKGNLENKVKNFETQISGLTKIKSGQALSLAAIPVDKDNNPVNGLALRWKSSNPEVVKIINDSQAIALKEGEVKLIAATDNLKKEFSVTVFNETGTKSALGLNKTNQANFNLLPPPPPDDPILTEQQADNLISPENNLGGGLVGQMQMSSLSMASATRTRERAGSANFSFNLPVAALPGRGIDASSGITYNSRIWSKSEIDGTKIFDYNIDQNWLAPGFTMGFGSLEGYSTYTGNGVGYLLTDPDGGRHQLIYKLSSGNCATYESTDDSFLQTTVCGIYSAPQIKVRYPDGSQITYGAITSTGKRFPVTFTDRNGNMVSVTYLTNDYVGKIAYIRDTLNRYITFNYDNTPEKKLVAVSVPGYDNSSTPRQTIRFYYEDMTLQWQNRFEDTAQVNAPTNIKVLKYVYFPGTQSGYKYDYSPYFGMIYKIWQLRGMQVSTDSLTETGTVSPASDNNWAAWTSYNYASTAVETGGIPLTDVPKYTVRKDDWQGRTTDLPITNYNVSEQVTINSSGNRVGTQTTTITSPNGTKSVSVSDIDQNEWDDGLLKETKLVTIENSQEKVWSKTKMFWLQGNNQPQGNDNPRLDKVEVTNDAGQTKATNFLYDDYNNQTAVIEHDFAAENVLGAELKRTETTYETGPNWINNHLLRLPKTIKTVVNNTAVAKIAYEYDGNNLVTYPAPITQHDPDYDVGISQEEFCYMTCPDTCQGGGANNLRPCDCPLEQVCETHTFNSFYRGNVTKATAFSDATLELEADTKAVSSTATYDITGNVVSSGVNCCNLKTWTYNNSNYYAYPLSETSGDAGQLTTSATYDLNTGLVKTTTDENNQVTIFTYNSSNLRLVRTDESDGAWATAEYNDANYPYFVKTTTSLDTNRNVSSWSFTDGRGQNFRDRSQTANGYVSSDAEFDILGRPFRSYNSYTTANLADARPSNIKFTETTQYDGLNRILQTKLADDVTFSAVYNGSVSLVTDQAGKSRRAVADALGRTIRVDEPDSTGNLGDINSPIQPTVYEYDGNNNLSKITQTEGGIIQERIFKYDSMSRLTQEKQVEANATLNSDGTSGNQWTGVYKYNNKGLLSESIDALGVKTTFEYDGLNRTKSLTYTGETNYYTPKTIYNYDEARNDATGNAYFNKGRLTSVKTELNANQGTPETIHTYDYDKVGQIVNHNQSIGNQSYNLQYGYNLAGQVISEKYPSGKVINMAVDNGGVLSGVADAQRTYLNGVSFNNKGLPSQINFGNGTSETFDYNDRLQMQNQSLMKGSEVLQKFSYEYGRVDLATGNVDTTKNNGQIGRIESFIGSNKQWSQRFGYDELGRLSEAREYKAGDNAQLSYKQKFDFDRFGNLYRKASSNSTTGQQNPLPFVPIESADINKSKNQLATDSVYDNAGQVITDNKFRQMNFAYDANGRQIKASKANTPDAYSVYDALGNRVATKVYNAWQYMIYDAFDILVAEYGVQSEGIGGVKYIQQDIQGSIRTVTNNNGFVVTRSDHQAFGEEIGLNIGLRSIEQGYTADRITRQGYGLTENDQATGQQHTWFRKLEPMAGRWTRPDPSKAQMELTDPQSFNRYAYVKDDPINFNDPTGLYTKCIHQAMTRFLAKLAGDKIAEHADDLARGAGEADSFRFAATSPQNFFAGIFKKGPSAKIHFPSAARLAANIANFQGYFDSQDYQHAGFVLHSIEDSLGAHHNYHLPFGHGPETFLSYIFPSIFKDTDKNIENSNFSNAANAVFRLLKNDPNASLTGDQIKQLQEAIRKECKIKPPATNTGGGGGGDTGNGGFLPIRGWSDADWGFFWLDMLIRWAAEQHHEVRLP